MDAQLVARRLGEAFSNDDLWTNPSIVGEVEDLADEYDVLKTENAKLRELARRLLTEYRYMRSRPRRVYLGHEKRMRAIEDEMRELGIEVEE